MKKAVVLTMIFAVLAAGAALAADKKADPVLATVNGQEIRNSDVDEALKGLNPQMRAAYSSPEGRRSILENLVDFRAFAQSGRDQKLQDTKEYKDAMSAMSDRLLFSLATQKVIDKANEVSINDADAQKYYDEHKESFNVPAAVRASHILIRADKNMPKKDQEAAQKKAADILRDIETKKITFEKAAEQFSGDGTRSRGGDLGYFSKGQMVPPFEKAAFALKKGEMTKAPVKTDFGWHIIKVTDTRDASVRSFDEVKEDIKQDIQRQNQMKAIEDERQALRKKYNVTVTAPAPADDKAAKPSDGKAAK
ncbi:MAG: peptidylprolyl isomerase [Pyramidobacter sp.]|jgi:peptidyl-prolyl cis-trans isomerase C